MKAAPRDRRRRPKIYGLETAEIARLAQQAVREAIDETLAAGIPVIGSVDGGLAWCHPDGTIEYLDANSVYRDLGYADAEEMEQKARLVAQLLQYLQGSGRSRPDAAALFGISPENLDQILRGQFREVSMNSCRPWCD